MKFDRFSTCDNGNVIGSRKGRIGGGGGGWGWRQHGYDSAWLQKALSWRWMDRFSPLMHK